jgi:DnaJ-class molecular chaperone
MSPMKATCPCCKGRKVLPVVEHDEIEARTILRQEPCTHCQGTGEIDVEVETDQQGGIRNQASIFRQLPELEPFDPDAIHDMRKAGPG